MKTKIFYTLVFFISIMFLLVGCQYAHTHSFSEEWSSDANSHWHAATCEHSSEVNEKADHTWDSGEITLEPTEQTDGKKTFICTVCQYTKEEKIDKLSHEHAWIDADCDNPKTCSKCNATEGEALGHTPKEAVKENEVAATCKAAGSYDEVVYCSVCEEEISRTVKTLEKLDHTEAAVVKENEVAATCKAAGSYDLVVYCSVCEEEISRETKILDILEHTFENLVKENEVAAACDKDGKEAHYKCKGCDKLFQLVEEEYVEVTELDLVIPALEHSYGQLIEEVAATCDKDGKESHYKCSECSKLFQLVEEEYIEVTELDLVIVTKGHSFELTSDENNHWQECSVCHGIKDEEAHKGGIATTTELAECEVCHEKYGELLEPEEKMITVYFQRNWDWANISIYVYTDDKTYLEAWPGKRMELVGTYDGQDLYAFTFDANEYESFIINGRNDSWQTPGSDQTPDLKVADYLDYFATDCFYMLWDSEKSCNAVGHCEMQSSKLHMHEVSSNWSSDDNGHWHACNTCSAQINYEKHSVKADSNDESVCEICGVTFEQKTDMVTVHFENNWNWTNVRIHIFNNKGSLTTWPGETMTKVGVSGTGNDIYAYTFDANIYTGIVITGIKNDGSGSLDQTPDIVIAQYRDILSTQYFYMAWDNGNKVGTWALPEELKK